MSRFLSIHRDPFRPNLNKEIVELDFDATICELLVKHELCRTSEDGIARNIPFIVLLNGSPVMQKDWNTCVRDEDLLQFVFLPRGGGGGGGSNNILTVVMLAILAVVTFGVSLLAVAAVGIGYVALRALAPGPISPPSVSSPDREASSPTYSLGAQGNRARLLEAMPRVYGRMRTFPDLAASPYTEYQGNELYLYQLFCVSLGRVEVEVVAVDDANLNNFEDATYEVINPGQPVTLFPDNVVTSDSVNGQTMLAPNNPGYSPIGPFVANPTGTTANKIAIDIVLPRGAGAIEGNSRDTKPSGVSFTFEYQQINDAGVPIGPWNLLHSQTITLATTRAQYYTYKFDMPVAGRYQVRGYRTSSESTETNIWGDIQWSALKAYLPSTHVYGDCTLIAVVMKATSTLNNSTARKFSVISKGLVQKWDPLDGWGALEFSANPAWIACDIIRNPSYGRGLPTTRFNVQKARSLAQTFDSRGDKFNGVFDKSSQLWAALSTVLRVGRTTPIYYAGVIDFIRDEPANIPTAQFKPSNIVANSFNTTYNFSTVDTPDHIIVEYIDENTWQTAQVSCILPGSTALRPYNAKFIGITNRDQAWREGISMAAANRDRRREISFQTELDGRIPQYNGLVRISHDVPQWGYSGRVLGFLPDTGHMRTTEPIPFNSASQHYIGFTRADGSEDGPYPISQDTSLDEDSGEFGCIVGGTFEQRDAIYISDGIRTEMTSYIAGPSEQVRGLKALVQSSMPTSDGRTSIRCINYTDSVYTAELGGNVPPPPPSSDLPTDNGIPIIASVRVEYTVIMGQQNIIAAPARKAAYYEFQARMVGMDNWTSLGTSAEPTLVANLPSGEWGVRVRAIGVNTGPWETWTGTIEPTTIALPFLDQFSATSGLFAIGLTWSYAAETASIASNVEIWSSLDSDRGNSTRIRTLPYPAGETTVTELKAGERRYFWARVVDTAGRFGPWFNGGNAITQIATADANTLLDALQGQIDDSQLAQSLLERIDSGGESAVVVQELINELAAMRTVKTQIRASDGKIYTAGYGVGVNNNDGVIQSEFIIGATNTYVIDPNDPDDPGKLLFALTPDGAVLGSAFIDKLTVRDALIGATLGSVETNGSGQPILELDFQQGEMHMRSTSSGGLSLDNQLLMFEDENGIDRIRIGRWAP